MERTLDEIKAIIRSNNQEDRSTFAGLTSAEIGRCNRALMFGEHDEAFPDEETWSSIVD